MTVFRPPEPMLHVDLDAFYASSNRSRTRLPKGKPVIVGGVGGRGVVSSASYEARPWGAFGDAHGPRPATVSRTGSSSRPDFDAYQAHSNRFREVLLSPTPLVEPISLDEAFLDVGGAATVVRPAERSRKIRADVEREVGVTCSVGVAPTKFVAKLASDGCKPDGICRPRGGGGGVPGAVTGGPALGSRGEDRGDPEQAGHPHRRRAGPHTRDHPGTAVGRPERPPPLRTGRGHRRAACGAVRAPKSMDTRRPSSTIWTTPVAILRELLLLSGRVGPVCAWMAIGPAP